MLKVRTYLAQSSVNGIGLFADEEITKGKIIWEYFPLVDLTYNQTEWLEMKKNVAEPSFEMMLRYSYKENGNYIVCTDNAQFMNHCTDNVNIANTQDLKKMFAIRTIKKGEELLCNYHEYSDEDDHHRIYLNSLNVTQ